jgi:hypothetical protein
MKSCIALSPVDRRNLLPKVCPFITVLNPVTNTFYIHQQMYKPFVNVLFIIHTAKSVSLIGSHNLTQSKVTTASYNFTYFSQSVKADSAK